MKKFFSMVVSISLSGLSATPAFSQGYYGAFDVGMVKGSDVCNGVSNGCEDNARMSRIAGGYQFSPQWGVEVGLGTAQRATHIKSGGIDIEGWRVASLIQALVMGTMPLNDKLDLIGKVGVSQLKIKVLPGGASDITATSTNLTFGIGAQYNFNDKISFRAQLEDFGTVGDPNTTGTTKLMFISAGLAYRL